MAAYSVPPAAGYPVFDRLEAAYRETHRHYHTFDHLYDVFRVVGRLSASADHPDEIAVAVWFHDVVYDPKRSDNEAGSAECVHDWLAPLGVPESALDRVAALVRATDHRNLPRSADEIVLVDADLAILGAAEHRYREYAAGIRREYAWVSDADYRVGRTRVLEQFLARDRIYAHPVTFAEGEDVARKNIRAELHGLHGLP